MKLKNSKLALAIGLTLSGMAPLAMAQNTVVSSIASVVIQGNTDSSGNGEGVFISSTGNGGGALINLQANGNGTSPTVAITGATSITGSLTTSAGITNTGAFMTTGTASIVGATAINTSGNADTHINDGASSGNVYIGTNNNTTTLGSSTNNIGVNSYATTNNMGTGSGVSTNNIGTGTGASTNNIGTGTGVSTNSIGNTNTATTINGQAGNAALAMANNSASLTVPNTTNNANGFAASNTQSSMTGGNTSPTRLTMTDNAATFSRLSNGAPITVTGVADGRNDYDAVNVRQFAGAVAAVAAQANVPSLAAGQDRSVGLGVGSFMGKTGLAVGMNFRGEDSSATYKLSLSSGLNGGAQTVFGAGAAWSF